VPKIAAPLTERQAARIEPFGLLADDPVGLLAAWRKVEGSWADAVGRAAQLSEANLGKRVNGEWSFIETLRHLIFVSDAWIGDLVLEKSSPYDPLGLPPDFITHGRNLGLDLDARPALSEVLASRDRAMNEVRDTITHVGADGLDRRCTGLDGRFTVLGAFQNVIFEEWAHHFYAARDLALLRVVRRRDGSGSEEASGPEPAVPRGARRHNQR